MWGRLAPLLSPASGGRFAFLLFFDGIIFCFFIADFTNKIIACLLALTQFPSFGGVRGGFSLKIPLSFFLFHTSFLVEVDNTGGAFRNGDSHHFLYNFFDGVGF